MKNVFIVSGNHDSPERLNFGSRIFMHHGVYIAGTFEGRLKHIVLKDEFGPVNIYLLPFIKPALVSPYYEDEDIKSYEEAVRVIIDQTSINHKEQNVLVMHQFITWGAKEPERCDSETISLGGLDNIDASLFDAFDYVALGHLHGPQHIGRDAVRYAGSPLKYSFSEARHRKSLTIVELEEKGSLHIKTHPLVPLRDMREIKGPLDELIQAGAASKDNREDYIRAILTDENELYDAIGQLRQVYPNVMRIDFENSRQSIEVNSKSAASGDVAKKSPRELFEEFYAKQNNVEMTEEEISIIQEILGEIGGAGK